MRDLIDPRRRNRAAFIGLTVAAVTIGVTPLHAEPPTLSLSDDAKLAIAGIAPDAAATIDLAGPDTLPISWSRGNATDATLPLVLMPTAVDPAVVVLLKQQRSLVIGDAAVPRIRIDARAYDEVADWRPTASPDDRRRTLLLAAAFATTLLLATLLRRGRAVAIVIVAILWSVGLSVAANRRPTLLVRDVADGSQWILATEPQTLNLPIIAGRAWVPMVASGEHLERLSPRIVVDRRDAWIDLTLPAGTKLLLVPSDATPPSPGVPGEGT